MQLVWGLVPSASKTVISEIPIELYIAIRWTISGAIFAGFLYFTKSWKKIANKDLTLVCLLGILGYGFASLGTLYGLKIGGVTNFALMGALGPVISSITAIFILNEKPLKLFWLALPVSIIGLFLLVFGKYQISTFEVAWTSAVLILIAYVLEAFVFVFSKRFKSKMGVAQYLMITQIATAAFHWVLQLTVFHQTGEVANLSVAGISGLLFVSIVACVLGYAILYWLLNHIDGHRLALFDGFHTLSAVICGYILFSEIITPLMIVGGILILSGLIAGNLPRHATEEIPE
ncbi:MAG: DMT family transporter [Bdellovibrionota bacterium]